MQECASVLFGMQQLLPMLQISFSCWNERWTNHYWPDLNTEPLTATQNTQRRQAPKVTRIIVSSPVVLQRGQYFLPGCHETCEQRVWLFLDIFSTPAPGVHWVGISNFITCHKRDTGCSREPRSLPPPTPPPTCTSPLARHHTHPWKSCLEIEDEHSPSGRLQPPASRRPYCLLAPNWFERCKIILIT